MPKLNPFLRIRHASNVHDQLMNSAKSTLELYKVSNMQAIQKQKSAFRATFTLILIIHSLCISLDPRLCLD